MLDQRRRRWAGVIQMLYKCFVFANIDPNCSNGNEIKIRSEQSNRMFGKMRPRFMKIHRPISVYIPIIEFHHVNYSARDNYKRDTVLKVYYIYTFQKRAIDIYISGGIFQDYILDVPLRQNIYVLYIVFESYTFLVLLLLFDFIIVLFLCFNP